MPSPQSTSIKSNVAPDPDGSIIVASSSVIDELVQIFNVSEVIREFFKLKFEIGQFWEYKFITGYMTNEQYRIILIFKIAGEKVIGRFEMFKIKLQTIF